MKLKDIAWCTLERQTIVVRTNGNGKCEDLKCSCKADEVSYSLKNLCSNLCQMKLMI